MTTMEGRDRTILAPFRDKQFCIAISGVPLESRGPLCDFSSAKSSPKADCLAKAILGFDGLVLVK